MTSYIFIIQYKTILEEINIWTQHIMNIIKLCNLNSHVCWLLKSWTFKIILNTYAGMPLNSSDVINDISLIALCSFGGFFVGGGSSLLPGSSGSWSDTLTLQNRDAQTSR